MKKYILLSILLLIVIFGFNYLSCTEKKESPEKIIAGIILAQIDSFADISDKLRQAAENVSAQPKQLQSLFLRARLAYKNFEWAAEYFEPATARFVNGPPVQEIEMSGQVFEPAGLQVIESLLFPNYDSSRKKDLIVQLKLLPRDCEKFKIHFTNIEILDWQVFDAAKLEMFRIETLGITGFDNPLTQRSMEESGASLRNLQKVLAFYTNKDSTENISGKFEVAKKYLSDSPDFNTFNRAEFITGYCDPITIAISNTEEKLKIHITRYNRLLNQDAKTLFDTNAFNVNAYAPDTSWFMTKDKVTLGKILFSDPVLSGNGQRSCESCHRPEKAFTDSMVKNTILGNNTFLQRNTPTLLNAALQPSLFYDMRVKTLEDQSRTVVQSNEEMHGSMQLSVQRLWDDTTYRRMFSTAFPKKYRTGIDTFEVMNAISSYVRSLVALNSRFDDYMRGNKNAMTTQEINGFNLFMGKAKCATCHYMPLFNGNFPPRFFKIESEVIGVPSSTTKKEIDPDLGRFNIINKESFRHAFKTSTVRNAARTAPYMHNGVFTTLDQVIDFYNKGGGAGIGLKINNQTLPFDKLSLTENESKDIVAFIRSLNSK